MNKLDLYEYIMSDLKKVNISFNKRYNKEDLTNDLFVIMCEKDPSLEEFEEVYSKVKDNLLASKGRDKIGPFSLTKNFQLNPPKTEDCDNIVISLLKDRLNHETIKHLGK